MNVEQRLLRAFEDADRVEPSTDLYLRVVHSIDEDRRHRQRVVRLMIALVAGLAALAAAILLSIEQGAVARFIPWERLEVIETITLIALIAAFGPAIRRFGRGYAADLFPGDTNTGPALLRLLDIAYWLVGVGYVLVGVQLGGSTGFLADQLADFAQRVGGLILVLGVLHAVTLVVLPLIALVHNSTRLGRKLPRWITVLLVLMGLGVLVQLPNLIGLLIIAGQGG